MTCRFCPGIERLQQTHDCERIVLQGRKKGDGSWDWVADVITTGVDGHLRTTTIEGAIEGALRQVIECEPKLNEAY